LGEELEEGFLEDVFGGGGVGEELAGVKEEGAGVGLEGFVEERMARRHLMEKTVRCA
jgi:hypothetical protein